MAQKTAKTKTKAPLATAGNGPQRDKRGRFVKGNRAAAGRASHVSELRSALMESVTRSDVRALAEALIQRGKAGNIAAIKLLWRYCIGSPLPFTPEESEDSDHITVIKLPLRFDPNFTRPTLADPTPTPTPTLEA